MVFTISSFSQSKIEKYAELYEDNKVNIGFTQANREQGIRRLTAINLMKRMESSVYSFNLTLKRIRDQIEGMVKTIDDLQKEVKKASVSKDPVLYIQGMYPTGKKAYFAVPIGE